MHPRRLIRDALVAKLKAGVPAVAERVHVMPIRRDKDETRPFLALQSESEDVSSDRSKGLRNRDYRLSVMVAADAVDDLEDALDEIVGQVEDAVLDAPLGVGERAVDLTAVRPVIENHERVVGVIALDLVVKYTTAARAAGLVI